MSSEAVSHVGTFQELRPLLFGIAYRMLGSADEADDVLQDAYLRFQAEPLDEVRSPKAYLSTIVTRLCLNELASARLAREQYVGPWLPEPIFSDDTDRQSFLETLGQACGKTDWQVHAFCLMSNHFLLMVETRQANLLQGLLAA